MAIKAATLCALAVLIGSAVAGDDMMYLDQATEQSLAARHINHGRMWQAFQARWAGNLQAVDVYMGSQSPCVQYSGTMSIRRGQPANIHNGWQDSDVQQDIVYQQEVTTSCDEETVSCTGNDCMGWHRFSLDSPVAMNKDDRLSVVLEGFQLPPTNTRILNMARVGVSPSTLNHGGDSSLMTSTQFKTKYSQYSVRTWLDSEPPKGIELSETSRGNAPNAPGSRAQGSAASSTNIAMFAVPAAVVISLIVLIIVAVGVRRRMYHSKYATSDAQPDKASRINVRERSEAWTLDSTGSDVTKSVVVKPRNHTTPDLDHIELSAMAPARRVDRPHDESSLRQDPFVEVFGINETMFAPSQVVEDTSDTDSLYGESVLL